MPESLLASRFSRRRFLTRSARSLVTVSAPAFLRAATPMAEVLDTRVISPQPEFYSAWSTLARRANGELWLAWSGGREAHVCPFGQVHAMKSTNDGQTWTFPRVLHDGPLDDRDAGVLETAKGALIVTTFSSLAYDDRLLSQPKQTASWPPEKLQRWQSERDWLGESQRRAELGHWAFRSTDGGITWSTRLPTVVNSPHGPIQLQDGRLLYLGKELYSAQRRIGAAVSHDDGQTWQWLAEIPTREGDNPSSDYHELHAVEATDGTLIAHLRNHSSRHHHETLQSESKDGGQTWSEPHSIGVWGMPSHLLRLRDGRLLMSYGHRRSPYGNQARLSTDHGRTWSEPITLSADGTNGDLGYPSTVELANGDLLTVWYEAPKKGANAVLRQARWRLA